MPARRFLALRRSAIWPRLRTSRLRASLLAVLAAGVAAVAPPASAQVTGAVTVQSDYEYWGYSFSTRKPVAILDLSYDHPSGVYVNGTAISYLDRQNQPAMAAVFANVGYARRVSTTWSVDGGLTHLEQMQRGGSPGGQHYTEAYIGVIGHGLSSRLYYSPDYFRPGVSTLYGELDWSLAAAAQFHLNAHIGQLTYLRLPANVVRRNQYDWRVGVSRPVGPVDLQLAWSGGGPSADFYDGRPHNKPTVTAGVSWTF